MKKKVLSNNNLLAQKYPTSKFSGNNIISLDAVLLNCYINNCKITAKVQFENLSIKNATITAKKSVLNNEIEQFKKFDLNLFDDILFALGGCDEAVKCAKKMFEDLHATVLQCQQTSELTLQDFAKFVQKKAHIGFWFFPNNKGVFAINCKGQVLCGDEIMFLLAWWFETQNKFKIREILGTVKTNLGIENKLKAQNLSLFRATSQNNFCDSLHEKKFMVAVNEAEEVFILWKEKYEKNPLFIARILASIYVQNKNIWIKAKENRYVQILKKVDLNKSLSEDDVKNIKTIIDFYALKLKDNGRVFYRYSGKQLCFIVESLEKTTATLLAIDLKKKILKYLKMN